MISKKKKLYSVKIASISLILTPLELIWHQDKGYIQDGAKQEDI